jgi:hypothetical protein
MPKMIPREEYLAAYGEARRARALVGELLKLANRELLKEVDGWNQGAVSLVGPANTWRAWAAQKSFDARTTPQKREIGEAISAWYFAMQMAETKWGGFRFAEPHVTDLSDPASLIR